MAERTLTVKILGDSRDLERALTRSGKATSGFERKMKGVSRAAGVAGLAIGGALAVTAKIGFDELAESQKVLAQTGAVLKSTAGSARVTAKEVEALAGSLSKMSGVDDEAIQASENLLLTFTKIRNETGKGNDIFDQATKATLNLSVAMHKDLNSSAVLVGKALNDPVKGLSALSRAGVQFSKDQQETIKALVATGDTAGAQKLILKELQTQFEGSAEAAGKTLPGQLAKARNAFDEAAASLTVALVPAMTTFANIVVKVTGFLTEHKTATKALVIGLGSLALVLGTVSVATKIYTAAMVLSRAATVSWTSATVLANAAQGKLALGMLGKTGLVVAAGAASFALTTLILKTTGLDKKLKDLGASAFEAAAALGLVNDPTKQFEGKTILTPAASRFIRQQAARLEAGGLTPTQAAARIAAQHPNVALRDIQVLAGVFGNPPVIVNVTLDGETVAKVVTKRQQVRKKRNPQQKRGPAAAQ